jgi:hypothetical protein
VTIDDVLNQIQPRLGLEAEAEHEILEEIRGHLEEAVAAAVSRGLDERQALEDAAAAFGVAQASAELRRTHTGWGTLEGVAAAALPVIFALVLRWLIFAPDGTADAWRETLSPPTLIVIAGVAILLPLLRFPRHSYSIALWIFFWGLSIITVVLPTVRWRTENRMNKRRQWMVGIGIGVGVIAGVVLLPSLGIFKAFPVLAALSVLVLLAVGAAWLTRRRIIVGKWRLAAGILAVGFASCVALAGLVGYTAAIFTTITI